MSASQTFECLIIGGGPGGLSTALALARILHTAVIFDSGVYRNRYSNHMHTVSTWDHKDPAEYRAAARKELTEGRYNSIQIKDVAIVKVEKLEDGGFKATDATGAEWVGRKLVLATGSKDEYPDIPGYQECWATGVFHCLFCHGFEEKDAPSAGILAVDDCAKPPLASSFAFQAQQFAKDVTIYTHGSTTLAAELEPLITAHNTRTKHSITIEPRRIVELIKEPTATGTITLVFEDGARETKGFLAHKARTTVNGPFVEQLGLELTPMGDIKVGQPFPETNVHGCFAVGDCATMVKAVVVAVGGGLSAAAGVSMQLLA